MTCTLIRVDNGQPFIAQAEKVTNGDGSVSFKLPTGRYGGQEPNLYGVRNDNDGTAAYQRATQNGAVVTFITRAGDEPMVYLIGEGQVY